MPKDEFDFDDPMELSGVAILTEEDTTDAMCECFVEEFLRMGYHPEQILALFRNPQYLGMNLVLQNRGEPFIRESIAEIYARWGRTVTWPEATPISLTPALSHGERENHRQSVLQSGAPGFVATPDAFHPAKEPCPLTPSLSPSGGEGARRVGEGEAPADSPPAPPQEIEFDPAATDPMGAAIPKLNL